MSRASDQIAVTLDRLIAVQGTAIAYSRGESSVEISAIPENASYETVSDEGIVDRMELRDYLIVASDLVLSEAVVRPARGDLLTEGEDVYEVMDLSGEGPWTWDDDYKTAYRVHTKRRSAAT